MNPFRNESNLVSAALALGARTVSGWSTGEERLAARAIPISPTSTEQLLDQIRAGDDPLGNAFSLLRSCEERRVLGATFTPNLIVSSMLGWAKTKSIEPSRVVEPGAGSARFLMAAARLFRTAELIGVEVDPLPAMIARANLAAAGFAGRSQVLVGDYRMIALPRIAGCTLYVGNPPYVRHHQIDSLSKQWLTATAAQMGHVASQLSGLHVYFFLATALNARCGDFGAFITSSEWLDVNYGGLVRRLFMNQLGGESLTVIEPTARPFEDAASTGTVTTFTIGSQPPCVRVAKVTDAKTLGNLARGRLLHRGRLESEGRWSHLMRTPTSIPEGHVELGELCRVHRGQVTGANHIWIAGSHSENLPDRFLFRTVTRASELFKSGGFLEDNSSLREVIDLPADLDELTDDDRKIVARFLRYAKGAGGGSGYIARTRRAWWSVGLRSPAPILATYMARRPPAFVRNLSEARHINIAHGLYPRETLGADVLDKLAKYLSRAVSTRDGRTYSGGLTKFEPREMERLTVPNVSLLTATF